MLRYLLTRHGYGRPYPKDNVVNLSAIPSDEEGSAKDDFESMRRLPFIESHGKRGIQLDNSEFAQLADYLYHRCGMDSWKIKHRLGRHYEGWGDHDWA